MKTKTGKSGPRLHANLSKVKVTLPGAPKGTGHLFALQRDGLHIAFCPGKGRHKPVDPVHIGFDRLIGLQQLPPDKDTYGTPAEECAAAMADLEYTRRELLTGAVDSVAVAAVREQLRRTERVLARL